MKKITDGIFNIGVDDFDIGYFEGQYPVSNGISYNSYIVLDEKITVIDTVDKNFCSEWLSNLDNVLDGKTPDYLIILHMEPDHSGSFNEFVKKYPDVTVVSTAKSFDIISRYFPSLELLNKLAVKEGDSLSIGKHAFSFFAAPMVHWPEVMVAYESFSKTLFSADAFGTFGVYGEDEITPLQWADEACRYYIGIVGKYGMQVQALLKKICGIDIQNICSLHGPAIRGDLSKYIEYYDTWSSYRTEKKGVFVGYSSIYGYTETAVLEFVQKLKEQGVCDVALYKIDPENLSEAISEAFRYGKVVLCSPTYNASIFPYMKTFITGLVDRNFQNKFVGFIENTSWAPNAIKTMTDMLGTCKNIEFSENNVSIRGDVSEESSEGLSKLACEMASRD